MALSRKTPLKRSGTGLKRGGAIKRKPPTEEQKEVARMTRDADERFYTEIWNKREHKCQECGKWLGNELNKCYMDHLLEKSRYPVLRYREENIWLVCMDHHAAKTNGSPGPLHKTAIEQARKQFGV